MGPAHKQLLAFEVVKELMQLLALPMSVPADVQRHVDAELVPAALFQPQALSAVLKSVVQLQSIAQNGGGHHMLLLWARASITVLD